MDDVRADILDLRRKIKLKEAEKEAVINTSITQRYDRLPVQSSGTSDKTGAAGVDAAELETYIQECKRRLSECVLEMVHLLGSLPEGLEKTVLKLRYVHGISWEKITATIHYSESHIYKAHREALEKLRNITVNNSR